VSFDKFMSTITNRFRTHRADYRVLMASDAEGNSFHEVDTIEVDEEAGIVYIWPLHDRIYAP
jgi:hypothetical protein